jgi:fructokinase
LQREGVDLSCVERLQAPTTLSLVALDAQGVPDYAFYGQGAADRQLSLQTLERLPAQRRVLQLGSYAMVVRPVAEVLAALVERELARGEQAALIAYDPNVRLNVEPDLARWRSVLQWMCRRAHVLKISDEDLERLHPQLDADAFARQALDAGVGLVVVTRGALGALGYTRAGQVEAQPLAVQVVDTVGAGDTFQAALLTWLAEQDLLRPPQVATLDGQALQALLAFATRAAALTCGRRGADLPRRHEL